MVSYDRKAMHKGFLYLYASIPNKIVSIKTIIIMKKLKLFLLSAFLCVGSLAVNSCGDDDDAKSSTPSTNDSNVTPNPGGDTNNDKPAPVETKTFTVTFNTDGGSEVAAQTVEDGKTATKPDDPTKDGFWFFGWYVGENVYEFTQPVSDDLTVIARWLEKTEYVDLGLPSGTLWATCNVGAQNPWDYGDYFAWGETRPKDNYVFGTYKYVNSDSDELTKYCNHSSYGYNGFTDNLTVLQPEDDAATANLGKDWRMPTQAEFQELYDNCDWEWTSNYNGTGVSGRIVKSRITSTSIFLPAAGCRGVLDLNDAGSYGRYWSSSLNTGGSYNGRNLYFGSGDVNPGNWDGRPCGQSVRPVRCK